MGTHDELALLVGLQMDVTSEQFHYLRDSVLKLAKTCNYVESMLFRRTVSISSQMVTACLQVVQHTFISSEIECHGSELFFQLSGFTVLCNTQVRSLHT